MAETSIKQKYFKVILLLWWNKEIEFILFYGSENILGKRIRNKRLKQNNSEDTDSSGCQLNTHSVGQLHSFLSLNFHGNPLNSYHPCFIDDKAIQRV